VTHMVADATSRNTANPAALRCQPRAWFSPLASVSPDEDFQESLEAITLANGSPGAGSRLP